MCEGHNFGSVSAHWLAVVTKALGILAKLMPQLQVFFVAVPINIMCGFLIMLALIGSLMTVFLTYYANSMAVFLR